MTNGDKYLYYGIWGLIVGFAMFYGWRIALSLFAPLAQYTLSLFVTDNNFDPIMASIVMNIGLDLIAGLCVAALLCFLIRIILKPTTMLFLIIPVAVLLGKSYWWLIASYLDNTFYPNNMQLLLYVVGPLIVTLSFVALFWLISIISLTSRSSQGRSKEESLT